MNNPEGGVPSVLTKMFFDFWRGGSQDLQRGSQWGIPEGSTVPAFASGASHYLGFVSGLTGLPLTLSHMGGGLLNLHGVDRNGPWGVSQQNDKNLMQGWSDATATPPPSWIAGTGAGFPDQPPIGQIGRGGKAGWISTLQGIDPANPTRPAPPELAESGPVIMVADTGHSAQIVEAIQAGADDFIRRPYTADDLENAIRTVAGRPRRETAAPPAATGVLAASGSGLTPSRQRPGVTPVTRLNARLKAASDSYPTSAAILPILASVPRSRSAASWMRQLVT